MKKVTLDLEIIGFESAQKWRQWLTRNYHGSDGIWMKIAKKDSGKLSVTYSEALDEALCFGWIDSQKRAFDDLYFIQKFTPRRPKSIWSKRNIEHVERLKAADKMMEAGIAEVERAQKDGRWEQAYDSGRHMKIPEDFLKELAKNKKAHKFFQSLNKTNLYAIAWRLQTAKSKETRQKRMHVMIDMLANGKVFHPAKSSTQPKV